MHCLALQNYEAFDSINEVLFITRVGVTLSNPGPQATRENLLQTAIRTEKEGFDSVWNITSILWPLRPQTPCPVSPGGSYLSEYHGIKLTCFDICSCQYKH